MRMTLAKQENLKLHDTRIAQVLLAEESDLLSTAPEGPSGRWQSDYCSVLHIAHCLRKSY